MTDTRARSTATLTPKTINLPSGRKGTLEEIRGAFKTVFATEDGQIVLDYLKYRTYANPQFDMTTVDATTSVYNLARHEFVWMIERMINERERQFNG